MEKRGQKLTKRLVESLQPEPARDYAVCDSELPGFAVRVWPSGKKVYTLVYRSRSRTQRKLSFGPHGALTCEEARNLARQAISDAKHGEDPADRKRRDKAERTLGAVLEEFLSQHVDAKLKGSSAGGYRRLARLYIEPALGRQRLGDVTRADIARFHHKLAEKPYRANRALAVLSKFFNWCEKHALRPDGSNPCRHISKYRESRRERFLSQAELARLGEALSAAEGERTATPWTIAAIRLLVLTGARLSEVLTLRWEFVDSERGLLLLPDSKTGRKAITLNGPALKVLSEIWRLPDNPFVVCGEKPGAHLVNLEKPWRRIRAAAGLEGVRLHDLRHTFASVAAAGGASLPLIGNLLGHSQPATTARYAHLSADPVRQVSEDTGRRIADAMGSHPAGEIVPIRAGAASVGLNLDYGRRK
jgi:integrase